MHSIHLWIHNDAAQYLGNDECKRNLQVVRLSGQIFPREALPMKNCYVLLKDSSPLARRVAQLTLARRRRLLLVRSTLGIHNGKEPFVSI